ncbi:MAG: hypothetical protein HGGPFJEG_00520 [Ignavibacteria bacterium]|nr:hypothetical protein [Ignavibacteria bacterium]
MILKGSNSQLKPLFSQYKAELILLSVTIIWGGSFPLIKITLNESSPFFFNSVRFALAFLLFCLIYFRKIDLLNFKKWKPGLILGIFMSTGFAFQTLGMKYTSASKSAFITGTSLVFIPFIQYLILGKKPRAENIAGALLVMIGLYILSEAYFISLNPGDLLTLICALCFAVHIVLLDKYSRDFGLYYLLFGQYLAGFVLSILFMLMFDIFIFKDFFFNLNAVFISSILYTSILSILLSIILMTKYQKQTTPLRAGIIYNMESIFAVFFSYIILKEVLNLSQVTGALIMAAGLLVSEFYGLIKFKITGESKI